MSERDNGRLSDLQKVLEISRALVAAADLDALLRLIHDCSIELLDAERATVFLYEPETHELVSRVATGEKELRVPADRGFVGAAAQGMATLNVADAYADPRFNPDVDRRTGFRTRNLLTVPLPDYERSLVGVLQVLNKRGGSFGEYDVMLAEALAAQAGVALQRHRLIQHFLVKQQMERAMKIAQEIQQGLLPRENPAVAGFDIAGFYSPADQTGGDIYDFMPLGEGQLMVTVADATGHGIGPALVIAETRAMLRAVCRQGLGVGEVLSTVNDLLQADLDGARFVTCFLGVLDAAAASLRYASAGHGPMLFYRRAADTFEEVSATGLPLAIMEGADYEQTLDWQFESGDFAVITTDGFFEAADETKDQFGMERMKDLLRCCRDEPAETMIRRLHEAVLSFTAGEPQADDLTAVVIKKS